MERSGEVGDKVGPREIARENTCHVACEWGGAMHVNIAKGVKMIRQRKLILPESVLHKVAALLFRIVIPARHENMRLV